MDTSYFGNMKRIEVPLSICRLTPAWYDGASMPSLAPSIELLRGYRLREITKEEYTLEFNKGLSKLDPHAIYDFIWRRYGINTSLICYEKPPDFCHRRLVAAWLTSALSVSIPERGIFLPKGGLFYTRNA